MCCMASTSDPQTQASSYSRATIKTTWLLLNAVRCTVNGGASWRPCVVMWVRMLDVSATKVRPHCVYHRNNHGTREMHWNVCPMQISKPALKYQTWYHTVRYAAPQGRVLSTWAHQGTSRWKTKEMEGGSFNHVMNIVIVWFSTRGHTATDDIGYQKSQTLFHSNKGAE